MNEGGLPTWKLKTRQPRAEGVERRRPEEIQRAAARSGCSCAHCPLASFPVPKTHQLRPQQQARVPGHRNARLRAATKQGRPALPRARRGRGGGPSGVAPRVPGPPNYKPGVGEGVGRGWRNGRRTQDPLPPPVSNLLSLASPSRPRPAAHPPRLTSRATAEHDRSGEYEQEQQKQAGEDSHGAAGPVSSHRPPVLSAAPAVMALLFIRAPGGAGHAPRTGPCHAPSSGRGTQLTWLLGSEGWGARAAPGVT